MEAILDPTPKVTTVNSKHILSSLGWDKGFFKILHFIMHTAYSIFGVDDPFGQESYSILSWLGWDKDFF